MSGSSDSLIAARLSCDLRASADDESMQRYGRHTTRIEARVGEPFVVELPVLATAGYAWQIVRASEIARLEDARTRPGGPATGGASVQEFEFVATHAGEGTLVFTCSRPWERTVTERLEVTIVAAG
jgi:predicted secreted protein